MRIKLFIQDNCPNCPSAKELGEELKEEGVNVELFNLSTSEGLAEGLMHKVLTTPSTVIVKNGEVLEAYRGETPNLNEVKEWL